MDDVDFGPIAIGKLINIGGMLQRRTNQLLLPYNLNQQQFSILFEIGKAGKVTQKSMVNRLVLEKAHVSKIIKKLNTMGLIDVSASSDDKRTFWISITEKGTDTVAQCRQTLGAWNSQWVGKIDEEQHSTILNNLSVLQNTIRELISEKE